MSSELARLPDNLPSIHHAQLPAIYERAKEALIECERLDECKDWANKAAALASYAKQADDETLYNTAIRIRARAIRRCGELLKTYDGKGNNQHSAVSDTTQREAAKDARLSKRQQVTAVRVANIPTTDFEEAIESDSPPTITEFAERGTKSRPPLESDFLQGRNAQDFKLSTQVQAEIRRVSISVESIDPAVILRGTLPHEFPELRTHLETLICWLVTLRRLVDETSAPTDRR